MEQQRPPVRVLRRTHVKAGIEEPLEGVDDLEIHTRVQKQAYEGQVALHRSNLQRLDVDETAELQNELRHGGLVVKAREAQQRLPVMAGIEEPLDGVDVSITDRDHHLFQLLLEHLALLDEPGRRAGEATLRHGERPRSRRRRPRRRRGGHLGELGRDGPPGRREPSLLLGLRQLSLLL